MNRFAEVMLTICGGLMWLSLILMIVAAVWGNMKFKGRK